ncbi:MAG: methyltransferase domain-containing protein [Candidatus Saccharicenans sp.]|uniref:spermine/spermidine synthase domain-containing protein n=1 Tax=Candidatus Saccharicenans sp. TaxID=2819258 RepID=UPI00404AA76E
MEVKFFSQWYIDQTAPDQFHGFGLKRVLVDYQSPFQRIQIIEVDSLGKCLIIDGRIQSAEKDEFIYHEALVHPPLLLHPHPRKVLVLGVGEGATIRELAKYDHLKITGVDIDAEMIDFSRKYLQEWHQGAFNHPHFQLVLQDGWDFIQQTEEAFDVIILDLPEPYPETSAYRLYSSEFYQLALEKLTSDGILVTQGETTRPGQEEHHFFIRNNLAAVFRHVYSYQTYIPSFDSSWGFLLAVKNHLNPLLPAEVIDRLIAERIRGPLRFYDGQTHLSMFYLPRHLRVTGGE